MKMIDILKEVKQDATLKPEKCPSNGICGMAMGVLFRHGYLNAVEIVHQDLMPRFSEWPQFSGHHSYPVPGFGQDPLTAFVDASAGFRMWDRNTPYGQARWELLEWLIEDFQK